MSARVGTLADLVAAVADGSTLGLGGSLVSRKPMAAVRAIAEAGRRDLELITFTGSLDVEVLVGAGAVRAVRSSAVSLGPAGAARRFAAGVADATIEDLEESEWMLLGGLRAAAAGLPFMPTRAAQGSDLAVARGVRSVVDPYTNTPVLAIEPLHPDVTIIHAWRADVDGNVQLPWPPDHLWDVDLLLARASRTTMVTVEEVVATEVLAAAAERTVLFSFEVDLIVQAPGGAWPTGSPPGYDVDGAALASEASRIL
jgi:glutaconate CoA-transferase subunit A